MYVKDPFYPAPNAKIKLWRFLDFAKFVDILARKSLYFSNLEGFEDPYEGAYPECFESLVISAYGGATNPSLQEHRTLVRRNFYINCWYSGNYESYGMWDLYGHREKGVAIQTTFGGLRKSIAKDPHRIFIGKVKYIDFRKYRPEPQMMEFAPVMHKRKEFESEQEARAVIYPGSGIDHKGASGVYIKCALDTLIEKVIVSPKSADWFVELVSKVTRKYGLQTQVKKSELGAKPRI